MKFHSSVLFVHDIENSKKFYIDLMGQSILHDFGKNIIFKSGLAIWELQPDHIIATKLQPSDHGYPLELYFEDENIDEVLQKLQSHPVRFLHAIQEEPWGQRTIRFFDPDGHLIEVGEPLHIFVENMARQGLIVAEISQRSGIHPDTVQNLLGDCHD
ncbi:MAG: VOC family protein [Candidatus Marinimicrobia bacterium]|nr:VOC family protein [Candidatus Neomarinimicrobiota bacterium]